MYNTSDPYPPHERRYMGLDVFWYQPSPRPIPSTLAALLDHTISVEIGASVPPDPQYEVLIATSPPREFLTASPRLRTLLIPQTGYTAAARKALDGLDHIAVHNSHHNAAACAETAVALMLACAKFTVAADSDLRRGVWDTRYSATPQIPLEGRTALLLGYGAIGRRLAPVCNALGMNVIAVRRSPGPDNGSDPSVSVHPVDDLDELLPRADVLIMALPATPDTQQIIGADRLDLLPPDVIVVNVGRAAQLDEEALFERLESGSIAAAGIDVWSQEPMFEAPDEPIFPSPLPFHELRNVVMSPHKAGWLPRDDTSATHSVATMLNAAARGEPIPNRVDLTAGY